MTTLLVASAGGHLAQLHALAKRMDGLDAERLWVCLDTAQARTLLADERKVLLPPVMERDVAGVLRAFGYARRIIRGKERIRSVISTGSAIALAFLPYAVLLGIETHYIESAARVSRPSLTGRVLQRVPGIRLYRQYPHVATGRWRFGGSVFDGFRGIEIGPRPVRRVVVTVGVGRPFRRLLEAAARVIPPDVEVLWQTGDTPVDGLAIDARPFVPGAELERAVREADAVVAHAGCGSALMALSAGKHPVLIPRDPDHGEVIDRHQIEIAEWLTKRGLATRRDPETLRFDDIARAAGFAVESLSDVPRFALAWRR